MANLLRLALEEASDGKANKENERVFYAKLEDFDQLKDAAESEDQEQWEISIPHTERNGGEGRIRIRKTTFEDGRIEYVLTTKTKLKASRPGKQSNKEIPIPTSEDHFEQFKQLAERGMIKRRYCFPAEGGLTWEIDVFPNKDKTQHDGSPWCPWIKIDLELTSHAQEIPPFPLKVVEMIDGASKLTEQQQELIDWLYETDFVTKNEYV